MRKEDREAIRGKKEKKRGEMRGSDRDRGTHVGQEATAFLARPRLGVARGIGLGREHITAPNNPSARRNDDGGEACVQLILSMCESEMKKKKKKKKSWKERDYFESREDIEVDNPTYPGRRSARGGVEALSALGSSEIGKPLTYTGEGEGGGSYHHSPWECKQQLLCLAWLCLPWSAWRCQVGSAWRRAELFAGMN